mmetsp:Transcript_11141/g.33235  ORF Transcript_11141/g.33235 Transcript_11141/m.33235 type:complete len:150 (+) Transcript_11141:1131-1580(+)
MHGDKIIDMDRHHLQPPLIYIIHGANETAEQLETETCPRRSRQGGHRMIDEEHARPKQRRDLTRDEERIDQNPGPEGLPTPPCPPRNNNALGDVRLDQRRTKFHDATKHEHEDHTKHDDFYDFLARNCNWDVWMKDRLPLLQVSLLVRI